MVIDFHMHIFPDALAAKALPLLAERSGLTPFSDGTLGGTLEKMKEWGISKGVFLNIATKPQQTPVINRWALSLTGNEAVIPFGTVHPDYEGKEEQLELLRKGGIKGIKIHPDYQGAFADDPRWLPIYDYAQQSGMVVLFHAGLDIGLPDPVRAEPERIAKVAASFPRMKTVAAHYGGYMMWERAVKSYRGLENLWVDSSFSAGRIPEGMPERIISALGDERVLFASDCPWECPADSLKALLSLKIPDESKERILSGNTRTLLGLPRAGSALSDAAAK